ncbi:hypothetical protein S40293_10543 [Stachybotrys chartarum IBT 40293]|nr:hypothetical protein S40293_10543 [Stachybotrys chartarum IBT 40293]
MSTLTNGDHESINGNTAQTNGEDLLDVSDGDQTLLNGYQSQEDLDSLSDPFSDAETLIDGGHVGVHNAPNMVNGNHRFVNGVQPALNGNGGPIPDSNFSSPEPTSPYRTMPNVPHTPYYFADLRNTNDGFPSLLELPRDVDDTSGYYRPHGRNQFFPARH